MARVESERGKGAVLAAVLCLSALWLGCEGDTVVSPNGVAGEDRIYVSGSATIEAAPDVAIAQVGVQTFAAEAAAAVAANNDLMAGVVAALKGQGVAEKDLQTSGFSVWPQQVFEEDRPDSISGYWANNNLAVTVRQIAAAGQVLQAAVDAGANQVYGLQFTVSDPDSLQDLARQQAVADARRRAEVLAEAAGVRLGRVTSLTESISYLPPFFRSGVEADQVKGVPIEPGELEVTAQVQVTFEIR